MIKYRIALIGLDGSGKSANISLMKNDSDFKSFKFMWVRWKPILLKPAYFILNKKSGKRKSAVSENTREYLNAEYANKAGIKKKIFKNLFIKRIWLKLAIFDYVLQFYIKMFGSIVLRKNIIFDRFYLDLFVDQGINFSYSHEEIEKEIKKYKWLFPKIYKYIYIKVDPRICYKRKDDIPNMDYLNRRYEIYEHLSKNDDWIIINGEDELDMVYSNLKKIIFRKDDNDEQKK